MKFLRVLYLVISIMFFISAFVRFFLEKNHSGAWLNLGFGFVWLALFFIEVRRKK